MMCAAAAKSHSGIGLLGLGGEVLCVSKVGVQLAAYFGSLQTAARAGCRTPQPTWLSS